MASEAALDKPRSEQEIVESLIGNTISITSKSEIRYEGIFHHIDTKENTIGLRNVRSFGTEGRLKDAPQIPANDTIHQYLLFRGSDIKDAQVIASAYIQPTPDILNDPAIIIESSFPQTASKFAVTSMPSATNSLLSNTGSHVGQIGVPTTSQGVLASYQHWPGIYVPSAPLPLGIRNLQRLPFLNPQSCVSMTHFMQYPWQYPGINASFSSLPQNALMSDASLPVLHSSPLPSSYTFPVISSTSVTPFNAISLPVEPTQANTSSSEITKNLSQNKSVNSLPGTTLPFISNSTQKFESVSVPNDTKCKEPVLKEMENKRKEPVLEEMEDKSKEPLLKASILKPSPAIVKEPMLPHPSALVQKPRAAAQDPYLNFKNRSKGRGRAVENESDRQLDFSVMNEKFNKQEVWGNLGKRQVQLGEGASNEKGGPSKNKFETSPYVEDNFFDDLSIPIDDMNGKGSKKPFEQRKIDIETFGEYRHDDQTQSEFGRGGGFAANKGRGRGGRGNQGGFGCGK